ncbi:MAG: Ig-like domain-containing protein [Actinomycetota bacterium]
MSRPSRRLTLLALLTVGALLIAPTAGKAISGGQKWAIVLCNFSDETQQPSFTNYNDMFQGTASSALDWVDYWRDNSYGQVDVSASVVTGWHTIPETRNEWIAKDRYNKRVDCGNAAEADGFSFSGFYGFVTIFPEVNKARLASTISASDTTMTVNTPANYDFYPTGTYILNINDNSLPNSGNLETVTVTAKSGNQFTITRGANGTTAKSHNANALVDLPGDIFGQGPIAFTLGGNNYTLGSAVLPSDVNLTGAAHETGHGFSYNHTRALSTSTSDYNDCYDIMSAYATCSFSGDFGLSNLGSVNAAAGPGITAIMLDAQGWLDGGRVLDLDNSSCNQTTTDLVALNQNGIAGKFVARIPASVVIPAPGNTTTTSDKYWLEYREATGWDQGVPPGVVLHLHGGDGYGYWVNAVGGVPIGHNGRLLEGDEFVDSPQKTFIAVNRRDTTAHKATITIAGCKINTKFTLTGATTQHYNDQILLQGDLTVDPSGAPVPNQPVTFTLGSQTCTGGVTNNDGHVECWLTIDQHPGTYTEQASFGGTDAYNGSSPSRSFDVTKEETELTYNGATTSHYHDAFTASGTLMDPDDVTPIAGKDVTFTLGTGDTCTDTTDGSGFASCSITPTQPSGVYTLSSSFGPDQDFQDATDSDPFTITPEETTTTYIGPKVILAGSGSSVTLRGLLQEDGANDDDGDGSTGVPPVPSGRSVTLSIGGGAEKQSCVGLTDANGVAQCTIPQFNGTLGPQPLAAEFFGDEYYQPSSDTSQTAIVFSFPSRGVFVLGDKTVDAAGPTTSLTWWGAKWPSLNALSGGAAPSAFKGFAENVNRLPSTSPADVCGQSFTTSPGGSSSPPLTVPSYMGVIVASSVTKSGNAISGVWGRVVVVKTDSGYLANPGHEGTGTLAATFCP